MLIRQIFHDRINSKAPLHVGFEPCTDTAQKCGFINGSVSMNMLSSSGSQGSHIELYTIDKSLINPVIIG